MPLIDQKQREQAIDYQRSFIVQAPAGSGKTGLLVRRLLSLLEVVEKPEQILAITFTRKATAEMRERVMSVLNKAQNGSAFEAHEQDLKPLALAVLTRDQAKQWQLLTQPARLKIQTIDALCAELVRKMPWSSRFGSVPIIESDVDNLYLLAAQNLIQKIETSQYQSALSTLLHHCNGNLQTLQSTLASALYQREEWLRLIFHDKAFDSRQTLSGHWQAILNDHMDVLETFFGQQLLKDLLGLARYAAENKDEKTPLSEEEHTALYSDNPRANIEVRSIQWQAISAILTTKDGLRKSISKTIGFPKNDAAKNQLKEILTSLADEPQAYPLLAQLKTFPVPNLSDAEWARLSAIKVVLPALAQELYVLMSERNCSDYDELSQRAIQALGETDAPTDLALIQDYTLSHILMDEFQDTSPTQLELLKRLTAGWQADDGRTLFLVGDPMQSIYAFRKADVRVFLKVRDQGINDIHPTPLELSVNFRSSPNIIDWVNQTMPHVFPMTDKPALGKVKYSPSTAHHHFGGAVQMHLCIAETPQCETREIIRLTQSIRAHYPDDNIAVLARKRTPLARIAHALREATLAFESVELETLAEQTVVQDLISLSGIFLQPLDTLAWLSVLRAPWCGMHLKDLTALRTSALPVMHQIAAVDGIDNLSTSGAQKLRQLSSALRPLFAEGERLSLTERVRRAWLSLRAPACYSEHALTHSEPFFEQLEALESGTRPLSRAYLTEACAKHKTSSPVAAIKLMTFHKAKGLEFDHVILAGLASKAGGDNRQQPLLSSALIDQRRLIAPSARADDPQPSKASFIKRYNQAIEAEEDARLLYVAVTRAKKKLYLFATLKRNKKGTSNPQSGSLLKLLWPECQTDFEHSEFLVEEPAVDNAITTEKIARPSIALMSLAAPLAPLQLPDAIHYTPTTLLAPKAALEFDWAKEDARIIGIAVHQILQFTDAARLQSWQHNIDVANIRSSLLKSGLITERLDHAMERVSHMLQTMAQDKRAQWLFDSTHTQAQSEWALSCQQQDKIENYIIDRSFIDENGIRWIIDFKTSAHEGSDVAGFLNEQENRYAPQLDQYATLVQALEPEREIRLGLYFPALGAWRERGVTALGTDPS